MKTNRPYVQIDQDVLERVRQIDLLSYLREFEPSNLVKVKGTQKMMATLYDVDVRTINYHVKKYLVIVSCRRIQLSENFG